jgi:hypothetical protein
MVMGGMVVVTILARSQSQNRGREELYNNMVTIKGKVEILNHPELGRTAGNGIYLLFQRDDCRKCVIAASADANGNYQIIVARGRYRVAVDNPSPPTYDLLAPDQPRSVNATSVLQDNVFDIKLVVQPNRR